MVYFETAGLYIESCTTLRAKITAIDNIISALLTTAANAAANENITEYTLNDGQTIIKSTYRGMKAIQDSINSFEKLKQMYVNRLNGRVMRLVDSKNFTGGFNGGR